MGIWITNSKVLNAKTNKLEPKAVFVENGNIVKIAEPGEAVDTSGHEVIDGKGRLLAPRAWI